MTATTHKQRVKDELVKAGVTGFGLLKLESRYLHKLIHEGEHIDGVIYGHYQKNDSGMMVATNKRVIFLDRKPFFTSTDELTYDVVSGVRENSSALLTAVTLHTRLGDYTFRYVNPKVAHKFVKAIERNHIELAGPASQVSDKPKPPVRFIIEQPADDFLRSNNLGVLSTLSREGVVQGSAIYYTTDDSGNVYILTKEGTDKARNILANDQVALTVTDTFNMQTLQIQGAASVVTDNNKRQQMFDKLFSMRSTTKGEQRPPVTQIEAGAYVILCIQPTKVTFNDYKNK